MRQIKKKRSRAQCKVCHRKSFWVSQNGLCKKCMGEKILLARSQMKTKQGPIYEKWKRKIVEGLEILK